MIEKSEYLPSGHDEQFFEPKPEKVPAAQGIGGDPSGSCGQYIPASQIEQEVDIGTEKYPSSHNSGATELFGQKEPPGQGKQTPKPSSAKVPAGQGLGKTLFVQSLPAGQEVQEEEPGNIENVAKGHSRQSERDEDRLELYVPEGQGCGGKL